MKKLIWVMTVALTVCAFTVWSYAAVSISSGRHIYIPILYILTWGGLVYLGVRSKTRTPLIASLVYWIMVIAVSATALITSSGIAETFLYKYLTAPAAFAFMPFFGFIDSGSGGVRRGVHFLHRTSFQSALPSDPYVHVAVRAHACGKPLPFRPVRRSVYRIPERQGAGRCGEYHADPVGHIRPRLGEHTCACRLPLGIEARARLVCILERIVRFVDMVCRLLPKRGDNLVAHAFAALRLLPEKRLSRIVCGRVCGDLRRTSSFIILYIQKIERKAHWIYNKTVKESKHQRKALQ